MAELEQGPGRVTGGDTPRDARATGEVWAADGGSVVAQEPEADLIASTVRTLHERIEEADREALRGTVDPELPLPASEPRGEPNPD